MRPLAAAMLVVACALPARAQIPLYAQRLPEGTVYLRFANALPDPVRVQTGFAGEVSLGAEGPDRISPYLVDQSAQGGAVWLRVTSHGKAATAGITVPSGSFVTVLLQPAGDGVMAVPVIDHPEYNQLRARLTFYNATADCAAGSLAEASGRAIFTGVPPAGVQARSINPVAASVVAACVGGEAAPVGLGPLAEGSLTSVWLMRPSGPLVAFAAHDTIAPPR